MGIIDSDDLDRFAEEKRKRELAKKNEMSKDDLLSFMQKGNKVTHRHFSDDEWMTFDNGKLLFEDGVRCGWTEFWKYRKKIGMEKGWTEYRSTAT